MLQRGGCRPSPFRHEPKAAPIPAASIPREAIARPGGHAPDLSTFFVCGVVPERDPQGNGWIEHPIEVSRRWDAKAKAYLVRERALPATVKRP
jgi:hypothetical protein